MADYQPKEKVEGIYTPSGEEVRFNKEWGNHTFSDDEVQALLNGDTIEFDGVKGTLEQREFKGHQFWGFTPAKKEKVEGVYEPTGETIKFNKEWSGHTFDADEIKALLAGEVITISAHSRAKDKDFDANGQLKQDEYNGHKFWGFKPDFADD